MKINTITRILFFPLLLSLHLSAQNYSQKPSGIEYHKNDAYQFNFNIRPGIYTSSLFASSPFYNRMNIDFGSKLGIRLGLEFEAILPFNNNRWSLFMDPAIQFLKIQNESDSILAMADLHYFEIPLGIRYYLFLNPNAKFFLSTAYVIDLDIFSKILYGTELNVHLKSTNTIAFGIGFKVKDKISIEYRYYPKRDITRSSTSWNSEYSNMALIFGYTLF